MNRTIISADFVYPNFIGGSAQLVYLYLTHLGKKNNTVVELHTRASVHQHEEKSLQEYFPVFTIKEFNHILSAFQQKKNKNSGVVFAHHAIYAIIDYLKHPGMDKVFFFHGPLHREYYLKKLKKGLRYQLYIWLQQWILKKSHRVLVLSEFMKGEALKLCPDIDHKILKVPPLIGREYFEKAALPDMKPNLNEWDIHEGDFILMIARRLTYRTGVLELAKHFGKLKQGIPELKIIVTGDGDLKKEIENVTRNMDFVTLTGSLKREEITALYHLADFSVIPTIDQEGFGLSVIESMAQGTPPLVSASTGLVEAVGPYKQLIIQKDLLHESDGFISELINKLKTLQLPAEDLHQYASGFLTENAAPVWDQALLNQKPK